MASARGIAIFTLAAVASLAATASPVHAESTEVAKCMDAVDLGAFKNNQWAACYEQEMARQDKALNAEYKRLQAKSASPDAAKFLVLGQRAWLAYRTSWCDYEAKQMSAPTPEFNRLACMVNLTASQTKLIHDDAS